MAKLYTCSAVSELIEQYEKINGTCYTLEEGTLGYGLMVCAKRGYKTAIVTEKYINSQTCAHSIRLYEECPEKYARAVYEKFGDILPGFELEPWACKDIAEYLGKVLLPSRG